jgi:hypothetical protein
MSLNDFENILDPDDQIVSKVGGAVRAAMSAKESLNYALAEALDASSTFGYELGAEDTKSKIIEAFEAEDSACIGWALSVVAKAFESK